jgi:hypothetical protein
MLRRLATVVLVSALIAPFTWSSASAGGYDSLTFRGHYLVGEVASARTVFFAGQLEGSGPLDGRTYYGYLLPESRNTAFGMIDPPIIPEGAILLGALDVRGPFTKADGYRYGAASLTFTVPDVPSGDYAIGFCDDPCTHGSVGWLAWGHVRIVHTPYEGRLLHELDRARRQVAGLKWDLRRERHGSAERIERLAAELRGARTALRVSAQGEAPAPREPRAVATPSASSSSGWPWWIAAVGAAVGSLIGGLTVWALGRRRRVDEAGPLSPSDVDPGVRRKRESVVL